MSKTRQELEIKAQDTRKTPMILSLFFWIVSMLVAGCAEQQQYGAAEPLLMWAATT